MTTKMYTKEFIKSKLLTDDKWLIHGLMAINKFQTADERHIGRTEHSNGVGFNAFDAPFLTQMVIRVNRKLYLSPTQIATIRKRMSKYAGQLESIANIKN